MNEITKPTTFQGEVTPVVGAPPIKYRIVKRETSSDLATADRLIMDDAVIERETRWLREAGQTFAASLLEGLWLELQGRKP